MDDEDFQVPIHKAQWKCKISVKLKEESNNLECELAKDWMNFDPKIIRTVATPVLQFPLTPEHTVDIELSSLTLPDSKKIWKNLKPEEFMDKTNCGKTTGGGNFMSTSTPWEGWIERKKGILGGLCLEVIDYPSDAVAENTKSTNTTSTNENAPPELLDD